MPRKALRVSGILAITPESDNKCIAFAGALQMYDSPCLILHCVSWNCSTADWNKSHCLTLCLTFEPPA